MVVLDEPKGWVALGAGLIVTALGAIPLLNKLGVVAFNLPSFLLKIIPSIAIFLIVGIALLLFIDTFWEDDAIRVISMIVSGLLIIAGIIEILHQFAVISWGIPFLNETVYYILFVVEGVFLIIATFAMF